MKDEEYAQYLADLMAEGIGEGLDQFDSLLRMTEIPESAIQRGTSKTWASFPTQELIRRLRDNNH